jgi:hypothetical protein
MDLSRRDFLASGTLAAGATLAAPAGAAPVMLAQAGPTPRGFDPADAALRYDFVIANADVLDPSHRLRGKRDIGIKNGQIAALSTTPIPAERATQRYDAGGRLTTPGLVDLHTHYGPLIGAIGLPADELVPITATTTGVSAGDAGPTISARSGTGSSGRRARGYSRSSISRPSACRAGSPRARCSTSTTPTSMRARGRSRRTPTSCWA